MVDALFSTRVGTSEHDKTVRCGLCAHRCLIKVGRRGLCGVRENVAGVLQSLVYGKVISEHVDPIEKKPLFHFLPGTFSYSIATVGCNFRCRHCQNYEISQYPHIHAGAIAGMDRSPEQIVTAAVSSGCASISYTYVEPTIFFEFALDIACLAEQAGVKNVFVSNGYTSEEAAQMIIPHLHGNNIDLKSFSDSFYKKICGARLQPVLDTITRMVRGGVWVEVTTLIIPGLNDTEDELRDIARFVASLNTDIPWHVSRFYPTYQMTDRPPTPPATVLRAREIGMEEGLRYVYTGNLPGDGGESTVCPGCQKVVIERQGYRILATHLDQGALPGTVRCSFCHAPIAGVFP